MMRMIVRKALLAGILAVIAFPAYAQSTSLVDLLTGNSYPITLKLKDLDSQWRRVEIVAQETEMGVYMQLAAGTGVGPATRYYTKGNTAAVGSETFIIAYAPKRKPLDLSSLFGSGGRPPAPEALTADTVLQLALMNIRTTGNLTDIRSFELNAEIEDSVFATKKAKEHDERMQREEPTDSLENLKLLAMAVQKYASDKNDKLPPLGDPQALRKALAPYVTQITHGDRNVFVHPETKEPYLPNRILSGRKMKQIKNADSMILFYAASPNKNNTRDIVFLDTHVNRVPESEWPKLKKASNIP